MSAFRSRASAGRVVALAVSLLAGSVRHAIAQQAPDPHAGHTHPAPASPTSAETAAPAPATAPLPPFIAPLTDADRAAAFPDVTGHHMTHGRSVHAAVLFDELEWRGGRDGSGGHWDVDGWIGGDRDRLWLRAEGVGEGGRLGDAHAHVLWGRPIARWWDVVAGVRQDLRPGTPQTWAAFGVQGFAPYRIDLEVTGYIGNDGRTQLRADAAHDLRLSRRVVAQTRLEATFAGKPDPDRDLDAGLTSTELGIRVRYEIRRELAPYVGVNWHRTAGHTDGHAHAGAGSTSGVSAVVGLRFWM